MRRHVLTALWLAAGSASALLWARLSGLATVPQTRQAASVAVGAALACLVTLALSAPGRPRSRPSAASELERRRVIGARFVHNMEVQRSAALPPNLVVLPTSREASALSPGANGACHSRSEDSERRRGDC